MNISSPSLLRGRQAILALALLAASFFVPHHVAAQAGCTPSAGAPTPQTGVDVDVIRDALGNPVVESTDKTRREYAHITSGLRAALGITVPADPDPNDDDIEPDMRPQIRVTIDNGPAGAVASSALFTVAKVIANTPALRVDVFDVDPNESDPDEDSGTFKLFESGTFDHSATVTVQAVAPSRTEVTDDLGLTVTQSFCEPDDNHDPNDSSIVYGVFENVTVAPNRDFVLLVPHGGMIEEGTSEQIAEFEAAFTARNMTQNVWEVVSIWDGDVASERFHITSKATDPQSFPGFSDLLDAGEFSSGIEFQHAASLHGFGSFNKPGIVFGGRADQEIKCYVARSIQQSLESAGQPAIAYYVYDSDGDPDNALNLPDGDKVKITDQRPDVGLTGRSCANIVNRLTQNSNCSDGLGGIQIEESSSLRDDATLRNLVSQAIADGFADMIEDPFLVDPAATVYCDALESAALDGLGQIGDTVWVDLDGNDDQNPGEPGREGVTVELLENGAVVATTTTAANGRYLFTDLASATYTVRFTLPTGFTFSLADQVDDAIDSDVIANGETGTIVIGDGDTRLDVDAGLIPDGTAAQIGDFVWHDEDGNGAQDPGELGLENVQVDLTTALGTPVASTVTDTAGNYLFTGLLPGDYKLTFTAPGWVSTTGATVGPFPLAADAVDTSRDAGFKQSCEDFALVSYGSEWLYPGNSGTWSSTWNESDFNDGDWSTGRGVLGYSESASNPVLTTVPNGATTMTYYFRHEFQVDDATIIQQLDLAMERDDGAVVYLNGHEIFRTNLPAGPIDASTRALSGSRDWVTGSVLDLTHLESGPNVLAVEIHQRSAGLDEDFAFDLELRATSCDACAITAVELPVSADAFLDEEKPTSNRGGRDNLWADGDSGEDRSALIAFDLSQAPSGTVLGAEIVFEVLDDTKAFYPVYGLETAWVEDEVTWNESDDGVDWDEKGATGALDRLSETVGVAHRVGLGEYALAFTVEGRQLVEDWISGAVANHGVIIAAGDHTNGFEVSSNDGSKPPVLRLVAKTSCAP